MLHVALGLVLVAVAVAAFAACNHDTAAPTPALVASTPVTDAQTAPDNWNSVERSNKVDPVFCLTVAGSDRTNVDYASPLLYVGGREQAHLYVRRKTNAMAYIKVVDDDEAMASGVVAFLRNAGTKWESNTTPRARQTAWRRGPPIS